MSKKQLKRLSQLEGIFNELTDWEQKFVHNLRRLELVKGGITLTSRQADKLEVLHAKCCERRWI